MTKQPPASPSLTVAQALQASTWALVDQPAWTDWLAWPSAWPWIRLIPSGLAQHSELLPALLPLAQLNAAQAQLLSEVLEHTTRHAPSGPAMLLTVPEHRDSPAAAQTDALCQHLESFLSYRHQQRRLLLRYYDPRVWTQLLWRLPPPALRALYGPVTQWHFPFAGHWIAQAPPLALADATLDDSTREAFLWIGDINAVWQQLPAATTLDEHLSGSRHILELLVRARHTHGLNQADSIPFAVQGMSLGLQFDQHPQVVALLQAHRDNGLNWHDTFQTLSGAAPQQITGSQRSSTPPVQTRLTP